MFFIPIKPTPLALLQKVQTDSGIPFVIIPDERNINCITLKFPVEGDFILLWNWFQASLTRKIPASSIKKLLTNQKQQTTPRYTLYNRVWQILEPHFLLNQPEQFCKFTNKKQLTASLAGINSFDRQIQDGIFQASDGNQTVDGIITPNHIMTVTFTLNENGQFWQRIYLVTLPFTFSPPVIKTFVIRYLTDIRYRFDNIEGCLSGYIAELVSR